MLTLAEIAQRVGVNERTARRYADTLAEIITPASQGRKRFYTEADLDVFAAARDLYAEGHTHADILDALRAKYPTVTGHGRHAPDTAQTPAAIVSTRVRPVTGHETDTVTDTAPAAMFAEVMARLVAVLERVEMKALPPPPPVPSPEVEELRAKVAALKAEVTDLKSQETRQEAPRSTKATPPVPEHPPKSKTDSRASRPRPHRKAREAVQKIGAALRGRLTRVEFADLRNHFSKRR